MKKIIYLIFMLFSILAIAQSNTFPTTGNVGIGTTSPYFKLNVENPAGTVGDITARILNINTNVSSDATIRVETSQGISGDPALQYWIGGVGGWYSGIDNSDSDKFKISKSKWGSEFTISSDGTIGMGTSNPNYWLDLGGGINANNLFRAQGLYSTVEFSGNHVANSSSKGLWSFINTGTFSDTRFYVEDANNSNDRLTFDFRGNKGLTQILAGTSSGNIGIGTTTPDSKLTVVGHVNIGGTQNSRLKTRHIDGKHYSSTDVDNLYLNYGNGKNVFIGSLTGSSPSSLFIGGKVGIGTSVPSEKLQVTDGSLLVNNSTNGREIKIDAGNGTIDFSGSNMLQLNRFTSNNITLVSGGGNVGIGTTTPDSKLTVSGNVHAQEVKVTINAGADFVFDDNYQLPKLKELESFIKTNKHLPEIASAKEMETYGLELGEMNIKLLQKIEELTLYTVEQEKRIENLESENSRIEKLEKENKDLENRLIQIEDYLNK